MEHPESFFTDKTRNRLRAAFEQPPVAPAAVDPRVRVMLALGFKPQWVADWPLNIPLSALRRYFAGAPIKPQHIEEMTEAAWQVVYAAQELLIQMSIDDHAMVTDPRWLAFSRRIFDCGCALDALQC